MTAKIVGLTRYPRKGEPGVSAPEMNLLEGIGIEGDFHRGGAGQVSLLSTEVRQWVEAQTRKGLCFGRFRENILIEGLVGGWPLEALRSGTLLSLGGAALEIGVHSKRCHAECERFAEEIPCRLAGCVCFAVVEQSGTVRIGDAVMLIKGKDDTPNAEHDAF